ncbi:MAG: hypothetical protein DHS80DRAFT_32993 [Piptocephalis tieghemiana]|nr:MAG: hypothetical protein DHS80DRAFT_32993 [Piptocephalis tieghemiana]
MGLPTSLFSSGSSTSSSSSNQALAGTSAFFPSSRQPGRPGRQGFMGRRVIQEDVECSDDDDDGLDDLSNVPLHDDTRPSTPGLGKYRSLRQRCKRAQRYSRAWRARGLFLALMAEAWAWVFPLSFIHLHPSSPKDPTFALHTLSLFFGIYALSAWLTHASRVLLGVGGGWIKVQASRVLLRTRVWRGQWISHSSLLLLPSALAILFLLAGQPWIHQWSQHIEDSPHFPPPYPLLLISSSLPLLALIVISPLRFPSMASSPPHPSTASLLPGGQVGGAVPPEISIREESRGRHSILSSGDGDDEDDEDEGEYWEAVPGYTISGGENLGGNALRGVPKLGEDWWRWWWDGRLRGAILSLFAVQFILIVLLIAFLAPSDQEQGRLDGMALSVGWILSLGPAHYVSRKQLHDEDEASWVIRAIGLALLGILIPASLLFFPPDSLLRILSSSISQAIGSCLIGASLGLAVAPGIDESWRWAQGLRSAWAEWEGARLAEWLTMWSLAGLTLGPLLPYMLSSITSSPLDLLTWSTAALALTMAALVTVFNRAGWLYHDGYELIV